MAWLTVIGPDQGQVDYRLEASAGCTHPDHQHGAEHQAAAAGAARDARVDYRMDPTTRLEWFGGGLGEVDITAGTALATEADKNAAHALMNGCSPDGRELVAPKRAAHPKSKLAAAPFLHALDRAAERRGVPVERLARTQWTRKRIARLVRMVAREGEGHRAPVKDLERIAAETGLALVDVYDRAALNVARAHRNATVRVGERGFGLTLDLPKSASVLWALGEPEISRPIETAFRESVRETLADLERWTSYGMRGRHGDGQTARRVDTSGFLGWIMWHDVARPVDGNASDPQLHAHCVIAHLAREVSDDPARDLADGWGTIAGGGRDLHRHVQLAGALTQARFRAKTTELGFVWTQEPGGTWEVAGVPAEVRGLCSKRAGQTNDKLREGHRPGDRDHRRAQVSLGCVDRSQAERALTSGDTDRTRGPGRRGRRRGRARRRPRPTDPLRAAWEDQAEAAGLDMEAMQRAARPGPDPGGAAAAGPDGPDGPTPSSPTPAQLAAVFGEGGLMTTAVLLNVRRRLATPAGQHPMVAPGPVRVVHCGDVLAQPEISVDTAPSPTPNRTTTGDRRERPPSTASMTSVNA
ncbi:relaxase domain-containing protein [Actinomadura kijaniata]|uniref:relaxase domain-containing protein n=1 Tax=Actinomadura kijaniata TaxID=46161 RepID=UPI00082DB8D1|nr:relaxase domain-containing protein [Actinomadura kijaniata]